MKNDLHANFNHVVTKIPIFFEKTNQLLFLYQEMAL